MNKLDNARNKINEIDKTLAILFEERMAAVKSVIEYKIENNLPIFDKNREEEVIKRNVEFINDEDLKIYFEKFLEHTMNVSKEYQQNILSGFNKNIILKRGSLNEINKYFNLDRKVLIISDDNIPSCYYETIKSYCKDAFIYIIKAGEESKSFENYVNILNFLAINKFSRSDCVVACGGGVVGDLAGFVSSTYMRGIEFYNFPTSLLAQVDSSIGGKTAIDFNEYKNTVGSFYNASCVVIDPNVLITLDKRNLYAGLVEAIKMGLTNDVTLFELIENSSDLLEDIEEIIKKSLIIKNDICYKDPLEKNIRKVLNFGHTIGHAIESYGKFNLLHGECVGIGILFMINDSLKERVYNVLKKYNLPVDIEISKDEIYNFILLDKKRTGDYISIVKVEEIGKYVIEIIKIEDILNYL